MYPILWSGEENEQNRFGETRMFFQIRFSCDRGILICLGRVSDQGFTRCGRLVSQGVKMMGNSALVSFVGSVAMS